MSFNVARETNLIKKSPDPYLIITDTDFAWSHDSQAFLVPGTENRFNVTGSEPEKQNTLGLYFQLATVAGTRSPYPYVKDMKLVEERKTITERNMKKVFCICEITHNPLE